MSIRYDIRLFLISLLLFLLYLTLVSSLYPLTHVSPPYTHTYIHTHTHAHAHTHTHTHTERGTQPKEEESIKDVVRSTFEIVWFLPPPLYATHGINIPKKQITRKLSNNSILDDIKTDIKVEIKNEINASSNNDNKSSNDVDVNANIIKYENKTNDTDSDNVDNINLKISIDKIENTKVLLSENNSPVPVLFGPQRALDLHVTATAHQIVDVIGDGSSCVWAVQLLRETLHGKREGDEFQNQVQGRRLESLQHCGRLVDNLIEMLLKGEEREEELMKAIKNKRTIQDHIVAVVVTMAVFIEAHPPFALPHLSTLLPYLKV